MLLIGMAFIFLASLAAASFPPADAPTQLYGAPILGFVLAGALGVWYRARRQAKAGLIKFGTFATVAGAPASDSRAWTALLWGVPGAFATLSVVITMNGGLDRGPVVQRNYVVESGTCSTSGACNFRLTSSRESSTGPPFSIRRSRVAPRSGPLAPNDTVLADVGSGFMAIPWIRQVAARKP